jgi:hypothetical protein
MKLKEQLEILNTIYKIGDIEKFKEQYLYLKANFTSESEKKNIEDSVEKILNDSMEESKLNMEEIRLRSHLIVDKFTNKDIQLCTSRYQ